MRRLISDAQAKFRKMVEDQQQQQQRPTTQQPQQQAPTKLSEETPTDQQASTDSPPQPATSAVEAAPPPASHPSAPPPPPPRERKVAAASSVTPSTSNAASGIVVTSSNAAGLVRPASPAPGPSNKSGDGGATSTSTAGGSTSTATDPTQPTASGSSEPPPPTGSGSSGNVSTRLRLENERLKRELVEMKRLVTASGVMAVNAATASSSSDAAGGQSSSGGQLEDSGGGGGGGGPPSDAERVQTLEGELIQAKEALATVKADRKRLKAEKFDLLNQMKQLYATLEDKEKELRDFIRSFEQERCERERERWSLLRHARDEAERSLNLAAQLDIKDQQLIEARRQLSAAGCLSLSDDGESLASSERVSVCRGLNGGGGGGGTAHAPQTPIGGGGSGSGLLLSSGGGVGGDRGSCSADSGVLVRGSSDRESGATTSVGGNLSDSTTDGAPTLNYETTSSFTTSSAHINNNEGDSVSLMSLMSHNTTASSHLYTLTTPKECNSPSLSPLNAHPFSRSLDNSALSRSVEQLSSPPPPLELEPQVMTTSQLRRSAGSSSKEHPPHSSHHRFSSRGMRGSGSGGGTGSSGGGPWGSISRVFARSRHRSKVPSPTVSSHEDSLACGGGMDGGGSGGRSWSPLTEEGYAEKLRLLREAGAVPMDRWRAPTVLAWLEIALGMPQYGPRCAENVKSGKVLLELSDVELECGLGVTHPMHRKKLRLAIEEHRQPALVRYPSIAQLGHTWVSSEWLPDLGLAQYSENFAANMVDARMLDNLSKKELEKFLGVTRKFHQASIVHGIHLLRMMKYDRQALAVRRHQCETIDADPLVWTNQRFIRWARNIDLGEYADNLKDSGVHGALVVLEPSLNGDTMATALGIPPSRHMIRRHLTTELEALVLPARSSFDHFVRERRRAERIAGGGGSLGRSFSRSYGATSPRSSLVFAGHAYSPVGHAPSTNNNHAYSPIGQAPSANHSNHHHLFDATESEYETLPAHVQSGDKEKDKRRASLRTYSLLYLKKFSSWKNSQSSLGRVLGLKSSATPASVSTSSLRISDPYPISVATFYTGSAHSPTLASPLSPPPPPPLSSLPTNAASPSTSSSSSNHSAAALGMGCRPESPQSAVALSVSQRHRRPHHRHRRVKSIGDITVTPV